MKKMLVLLGLSCLLSVVCYADNFVSEERTIDKFSAIAVTNGIDVYLTSDADKAGTIRVESNKEGMIENVKTEVSGNTLKISLEKGNPFKGFNNLKLAVYVSVSDLHKIEASGGSDVKSSQALTLKNLEVNVSGGSDADLNVNLNQIKVSASSGSDVDLKGTAENFEVAASGGSDINAKVFIAKHVVVSISGGSDASVHASESLKVSASGGSDLSYAGNPSVKEISSSNSSDIKAIR